MKREEALQDLIDMLMEAQPRYQTKLPRTGQEQRTMLRGLMNTCPPMELPAAYFPLQDALLQEELAQKRVTDGEALPAVEAHPQISLWRGDITTLKVDAIVNAANESLLGCFIPCHRCIDNAIHSAAGLQLRMACDALMRAQGKPEPTGKAKLTEGFGLPARYVLHTVGPIITAPLRAEDCALLASCYRACLELAEERGLSSLAFCCISTGEFHFPPDRAAGIAVETVTGFLPACRKVKKVVFSVFSEQDLSLYRSLLGADRPA